MEICLILEEFSAIMGKPDISALILPTTSEDLSNLAHQLLGIPLAMAQKWCRLNKLNTRMVFIYFSLKNVPLAKEQHFH